jgi:outer membrane protein OmpA-like peptidoglycan-associated protein
MCLKLRQVTENGSAGRPSARLRCLPRGSATGFWFAVNFLVGYKSPNTWAGPKKLLRRIHMKVTQSAKLAFASASVAFFGLSAFASHHRNVCQVEHGVTFYSDNNVRVSNYGIADDAFDQKDCAGHSNQAAKKSLAESSAITTSPIAAAAPAIAAQLKEQKPISLDVRFETGSAKIDQKNSKAIDELVAALKADPSMNVNIEGHTDSIGSAALNQRLSTLRADALRAYLIKNGIAADRLKAKGFGASAPVASNADASGRAQNRRLTVEAVR